MNNCEDCGSEWESDSMLTNEEAKFPVVRNGKLVYKPINKQICIHCAEKLLKLGQKHNQYNRKRFQI